jgi:hypothetical protein
MKPLGWVILASLMIKAFGLVPWGWLAALTPFWFLLSLVVVKSWLQVRQDQREYENRPRKTFKERLKEYEESN